MKFLKESGPQGIRVPAAALKLSHIPFGEPVELHTMDHAIVLLKGWLTAPELLAVVRQLSGLAAGLLTQLARTCGPCEDCGYEHCPLDGLEGTAIQEQVTPELLETFLQVGTCLGELEEHLVLEDVVYGC